MEKSERKSKKKHKRKLEELQPMASYVSDRPALLAQLFSALPKDKMLAMLPPVLRDIPQDELRADCLEVLLGLSARRVRSVLRGEQLGSSSSSETDSQSEVSREVSPNREPPSSPSTVPAKENCSLLEIVELQLRARAIRAALSHGEDDGEKEPPPPTKKSDAPTTVSPENIPIQSDMSAESVLEPSVEPKVVRAKKRPVLVGPLKRLGKRVLLTTSNGPSSTQPSTESAEPVEKPMETRGTSLEEISVEAEDKTSVKENEEDTINEEPKEEASVLEEKVPKTINAENEVDGENEAHKQKSSTSTDRECVQAEAELPQSTSDKMTPDEACTDLQDATWIDRRLQQAASPTLRSSLIGSTRQRLANNDSAADSTFVANESQAETPPVANSTQADANEGSVSQYASLASNSLDIEPLVLNYEED